MRANSRRRRPPIKLAIRVGEAVHEIEIAPFVTRVTRGSPVFWRALAGIAARRGTTGQGYLLVPCAHCGQRAEVAERDLRATRRKPLLNTVCLYCGGVFEARAAMRHRIEHDGMHLLAKLRTAPNEPTSFPPPTATT